MALLLMFELETWHLNPQTMTVVVKRTLLIARVLCYGLILSAFAGYTEKLLEINSAPSIAQRSFVATSIQTSNCDVAWTTLRGSVKRSAVMTGAETTRRAAVGGNHRRHERFKGLAWIDVLNAAAWL